MAATTVQVNAARGARPRESIAISVACLEKLNERGWKNSFEA